MENDLAVHINEALQEHGWSQRELARRAGLSATAISQIVNATVTPQANTIVRIALALDEDPQHLLRLAGHLPAAPPPTNHDEALLAKYRALPAERQNAIAVLLGLAGQGAEHAPAVSSPSGRGPTEDETLDARALWEEVVFEMEYCGRLLLEGWTDRAEGERHFLALQQGLLRLFWTLMDQDDQAWTASYTQRMLNAYRRHREQHEQHGGERHKAPTCTDTA